MRCMNVLNDCSEKNVHDRFLLYECCVNPTQFLSTLTEESLKMYLVINKGRSFIVNSLYCFKRTLLAVITRCNYV